MALKPAIEELKQALRQLVEENRLGGKPVRVTIGTLSASQAIGNPERKDFPLLEGREVMIEAHFQDSCGQAFTDRPHEFSGSLDGILHLSLQESENRAIFVATLNAVTAHLDMAAGTRHCRDEEPERCAAEMAEHILKTRGKTKVGLIGLQPAILDQLVKTFGAKNVRCTDLNPKNVGTVKYGAEIWDGRTGTGNMIKWCDLLLVTSSTIVNGTYDRIRAEADIRGKKLVIFGVTGAGAAALLGLERYCFQAS